MKEPTIKEQLKELKHVICNEIKHELKWHRWLLLIILSGIIAAGALRLFG